MRNLTKYFLAIPLVLIFGIYSCSEDPNDSNQKITVQTNRSDYTNGEMISFTIKNLNSSTGHLASCCNSVAFYIDKNENGNWVEHTNFGLPCLSLCPGIDFTIGYLETIADSITFNENGTFRIRIPYTFNPNQGWTGEIVSNPFIIE
jgi:hypothetical protein